MRLNLGLDHSLAAYYATHKAALKALLGDTPQVPQETPLIRK